MPQSTPQIRLLCGFRSKFRIPLAADAVQAASRSPDRSLDLWAQFTAANISAAAQPTRSLASSLGQIGQRADIAGLVHLSVWCTLQRADTLLRAGDPRQAHEQVERALAKAETLGLRELQARGEYVLGAAMRLGGRAYSNLRDVPVFDFTEEGDTPAQGMLGVPFLVSAGAVVDFSRDELVLGATPSDRPAKKLLEAGYTATRFAIGANDRVALRAFFPALGRAVAISPSTVSSALTLHQPLFAGKVPMRKEPSPDRSPSRTSTDVYRCDRVGFEIEGDPDPVRSEILEIRGVILGSEGVVGCRVNSHGVPIV